MILLYGISTWLVRIQIPFDLERDVLHVGLAAFRQYCFYAVNDTEHLLYELSLCAPQLAAKFSL